MSAIVEETKKINLKPIFKWSGGKKDEIPKFCEHIPKFSGTYLEPFIGGGAVFFHLNPTKAAISDMHKELIDFYQSIKNGNSDKIYDFMKSHPNEPNEYYKVRDIEPKDILERGSRFYYLRKTCFRGILRYNSSGGFNIPFGKYKKINLNFNS